MIILYNEYINENLSRKDSFFNYIKDLFTYNNNIRLSYREHNIINIHCFNIQAINHYVLFKISVNDNKIIFYTMYDDDYNHSHIFSKLKDFKKFLLNYNIKYYDLDIFKNSNIFYNNKIKHILNIPVLNIDAYNVFIDNMINKKIINITDLIFIKNFLNEDMKYKYKYILDANNFDLL